MESRSTSGNNSQPGYIIRNNMQLFQTQVQCQDGLWAKLDAEHPVPVLIMNEMEPRPVQISVAEQKEVTVANLPDFGEMLSPLSSQVATLVDKTDDLSPYLESIVRDLSKSLDLVQVVANKSTHAVVRARLEFLGWTTKFDRISTLVKYALIVQGATCILALAALIVAIVR